MVTRMVKVQLVIFSILTLVTASAIVFIYADLPAKYGWWGQTYVTATFEDGAGIYKAGNVTYRGVGELGEVTDIDLNPDGGVDVEFRYDSDLDVPANVRAEIHAVSAVGEFYVDLVPPADPSEEKLEDGDHIPIERTSVPLAIAPVLDDVNTFLQSIPQDSLSAFMDEAAAAFDGLGPDLVKLLVNAQRLVDEANANYLPTKDFLRDIGPLFDTQNQVSEETRGWARNLASFTDTLRANDAHLEGALSKTGVVVQAIDSIVRDITPTMATTAAHLTSLGELTTVYKDGLEQVFLLFPQAVAKLQVAFRTPGLLKVDIAATLGNPPGCSIGYPQVGDTLSTRNPFLQQDFPAIQDAYCKVPQNDPRAVRGARNLPCLEGDTNARGATVEDCFQGGYDEAQVGELNTIALPNVNGQAASATYDENGRFLAPDGNFYVLGSVAPGAATGKDTTWQGLLLPARGE